METQPGCPGPSTDLLWKQYALYVDLYKFYLDAVIKMNAFYYGVTGGILAFYFKNSSVRLIKYALLFPILASLALALLYFYGAVLIRILRDDVFKIRDALRLSTAPDLGVLSIFLCGSGGVALVVGVAMFVLLHDG